MAHHLTRKNANKLAHKIYDEADEQATAMELANAILSSGKRGPNPPISISGADSNITHSRPLVESKESIIFNAAIRLKEAESLFSGHLGECWTALIDSYNKMTQDCSLKDEQTCQYLHNLLHKDATRFCGNAVQPYAAKFQMTADMISAQYNSPVRQNQILDYLKILSVDTFVETRLVEWAALVKVYAEVV